MEFHILHLISIAITFHMTLWRWHQQIRPPNCPCQELRKLVILARPHGFYHESVIAFSKLLRSVELSEVSSLSMFGYLVMPVVSCTKGMPLRQFLRPRLNLHRGLIMASCGCQNALKDVWLQKHKGLCVCSYCFAIIVSCVFVRGIKEHKSGRSINSMGLCEVGRQKF